VLWSIPTGAEARDVGGAVRLGSGLRARTHMKENPDYDSSEFMDIAAKRDILIVKST
jgi:hypothetical protein